MIPEFDPLKDNVEAWLNIIKSYASTFGWSDSMIRYQALNKLKGSAKIWYDSLLRTSSDWTKWIWADWSKIIATSFQIKRNMYELLKDVIERKPTINQSLYEFFFDQKCKIDRLGLNFSEQDIISIILGNLSDCNLSASIEASNFMSCDSLAAFLHSRTYKCNKPILREQTKPVLTHSTPKDDHTSAGVTTSASMSKDLNQQVNRKDIRCFGCGGAHKRTQCNIKCDFCGKKGHTETVCYSKAKSNKIEKQEVKCLSAENPRDKFIKQIYINKILINDAFIDTGSSCSLIQKQILLNHKIEIQPLDTPVILHGFSKDSSQTVTHHTVVDLQIDSVLLSNVQFYVIDEICGCSVLIGRNITERTDLMYCRIGNTFKFSYSDKYEEFCNVIQCTDFDADFCHEELIKLFNKYEDCIAKSINSLGKVNNFEMSINLSDDKPIHFRPYRVPYSDREIMRKTIEELIQGGIIRDSGSAYASPALLVNKKDGEKRLCIDYRALNRITVKDKYPMPRIEDLIDRLKGYTYFTSLDLKCGYYQIKMEDASIHKTAFTTEDGHYEFLRLPFGLVNAPSYFQQMINKILGNLRFDRVISYLDDLLLLGATIDENIELLEIVLKKFREHGLTLNLKKCHFLKTEIEFLGYKISKDSIKPSDNKIEAVKKFPTPKTVHQVRQFLGLISYFRKFIKDCAVLSSPLSNLLKKETPWSWNQHQENAFQILKSSLTSDNILFIFDPNKESVLYTDACRDGIAGILMQVTDQGEKPVHFYSRQTSDDEKKYHSFELELMAIVASLQKFRLYLLGSHFKIVTDCSAVRHALSKKEIIPRIARWVLSTQEFDFTTVHREGMRMQHVDALSRNPVPSGQKTESEIVMSITESDWLLAVQLQDPILIDIRNTLQSGEADKNQQVFANYDLLGNKVYRRTNEGRRWVVPKKCIWQVIKCNHDDLGHFAVDKTLERIQSRYWFPRMRHTIKKYIKNCLNCIYYKNKDGRKEGELYPIPKYAQPFHTLHIDHLGPFVTSINKNKYLLVIVDAFTKFVFISPVPNTDSVNVINELESISKIFGNTRRLISDAGSCFTSNNFKQYCIDKNIRLHTIATGMPRSNGQAERFNKTILESMRAMGASVSDDRWDECIKALQQALNTTFHKTIKAVPSEVFFGYRLRTDSDSLNPEELGSGQKIDVTQLRRWVDDNIKANSEEQKERFDAKRTTANQYELGDLVLVKIQSQSNDGASRKLLPVFKGPFQVTKVLQNDRYEVSDMRGGERCQKLYTGVSAAENMKPWININNWTL